MNRILVVDDESRIRDVVRYALEREGFGVEVMESGTGVVSRCQTSDFDLLVLDIMMPGPDGLEICRSLRRSPGLKSEVPILFLSAKSEEIDRVVGLELGGDDYLAKPFSPRELVARVKAILRRSTKSSPPEPPQEERVIEHGPITVNPMRHQVRVQQKEVGLTPTEFGVLAAILERPGVVLSRRQLMERAYTFDNHVTERTIDTHVRRIRAKFRNVDGPNPIQTVFGVGYKAGE